MTIQTANAFCRTRRTNSSGGSPSAAHSSSPASSPVTMTRGCLDGSSSSKPPNETIHAKDMRRRGKHAPSLRRDARERDDNPNSNGQRSSNQDRRVRGQNHAQARPDQKARNERRNDDGL